MQNRIYEYRPTLYFLQSHSDIGFVFRGRNFFLFGSVRSHCSAFRLLDSKVASSFDELITLFVCTILVSCVFICSFSSSLSKSIFFNLCLHTYLCVRLEWSTRCNHSKLLIGFRHQAFFSPWRCPWKSTPFPGAKSPKRRPRKAPRRQRRRFPVPAPASVLPKQWRRLRLWGEAWVGCSLGLSWNWDNGKGYYNY